MTQHPSTIIRERDKAMAALHLAVATELGVPVAGDVVSPSSHWVVVDEAERRYRAWSTAMEGSVRPVMRTKTDVALSNLHGIDHQKAFSDEAP